MTKWITSLFLLPLMWGNAGEPLRVTGRARVVNGQTEVPRGLFGVHATPLTPERIADWGVESIRTISHNPGTPGDAPHGLTHVVECFWDRYQPALIVSGADWAERLRVAARTYGEAAKTLERPPIVEFWNEPYLNWGVRPGVNYNGAFYKAEGREPGGPMTLLYETEATPYLEWTEQKVAVRADNGQFDALASRFMPGNVEVGGTWTWRNRMYRAEMQPWGKDTTQTSFWPGKQNVLWYNQMMEVFAPALKEANPDVTLVVGWDFHIHQNSYEAWETVHRPTIDAAMPWADGYAEHHYGGNTLQVAGSFEFATAYTMTRHGRALKFYNTEAGGDLDPERPGWAQPGYNTTPPAVRDRAAYTYMMRDVLHLIDRVPDKAEARAAHEAHHNRGVPAAFRMLRPLRGTLMETVSPHTDKWVVASLNGNQLVVVAFNDTRGHLAHPLEVQAPRGTTIAAVTHYAPDAEMTLVATELDAPADGRIWRGAVDLAVRESGVWVLDLTGDPAPETVHRTQYYAPELLQSPEAGEYVTLRVDLPAAALSDAPPEKAWVRLAHAVVRENTAILRVNGHETRMQPSDIGIFDTEIPVSWLRSGENLIEVHRLPDAGGMRIDAGSLMLQR